MATKAQARDILHAAGYKIFVGLGSSGDFAFGSREYYRHVDGTPNQYGIYQCAAISKIGRGNWSAYTPDLIPAEEWQAPK